MAANDLTALFSHPESNLLDFRQGVVIEWDTVAHTNLINIGGTDIENILYLGVVDSSIVPGVVIGLLRHRSTYFIIGRIKEI